MSDLALESVNQFSYRQHVLGGQRSVRGRSWEEWFRKLDTIRMSSDPQDEAAIREANAALAHLRDLGPDAVHVDATMREMSIRYQNDEYIGERLAPICTVQFRSNFYFKYDERAQQSFPDDTLGPRGQANEVRQALTKGTYTCVGRGLTEFVDLTEIGNADAPLDPLTDANILVNEGIAFNREKRIMTLLTTAGNFGSNTTAVSAGAEWNSADGGKPIQLIQKAIDSVYSGMGPSKLMGYCSVNVFRTLSRHPAIRDLFKYTKDGFATAQQIAAYFGLDELLVGKARQDRANEGQAADVGRIWPDSFGVVRVAMMPSIRSYGFATTFRHGPINTIQLYDRKDGENGGYTVKVTVAEDHQVVAPKAGYLITGCFDSNLP